MIGDVHGHYDGLMTLLEAVAPNSDDQVYFLGHKVSKDAISVDSAKIEAVSKWPIPKNAIEIRSFLGLAGCYRRFVDGFARLAELLTALTRKEKKYEWTAACE